MGVLKNWVVILYFAQILCFLHAQIDFPSNPSATISTLWRNQNSAEQQTWRFVDGSSIRPLLFTADTFRNTFYPSFGFGFFENGTTPNNNNSYYLVVFFLTRSDDDFILRSPVIAWTANRDRPVRENAILNFTSQGNLELRDVDNSLAWSSNTSNLSVTRLNLTSEGNLMLLNNRNNARWQSFDHPTDTWLPNQRISVGNRLSARSSRTSLATGLYYMSVTSNGLDAFIRSVPLQMYRSLMYIVSQFSNSRSIPLGELISIEGISNYSLFSLPNITTTGFHYIVLEPSGHLNLYRLDRVTGVLFNVVLVNNIFNDDIFGDCDYPNVCGSYGICSSGECSCPRGNSTYFTQLQEFQPSGGCRRTTALSCRRRNLHDFVELRNVTYFNMENSVSMDVVSCRRACLEDCSCEAAFFSSGRCSLQSCIYSMKHDVNNDSIAFIKVQRSTCRCI